MRSRERWRYTGGAVAAVAAALESLEVDAARMRHNLDAGGGTMLAERISLLLRDRLGRREAQEVVGGALSRSTASGGSFRDELLADARTGLAPDELDAALDPATYVGAAAQLVDRALALYEGSRTPAEVDA